MKTLIVVIHPDIQNSVINKRWIEEVSKFPEKYAIHQLYDVYSDEKIDVEAEQMLLEQYENIVFQFPVYWFNCPPLFKKWLDEVLTYGWAYGSTSGYKLSGKHIAFGVTVGISEKEYSANGRYLYTMEELIRPFELTIKYVKAEYKSFFAYYDIEKNSSDEWIENSVKPYVDFIDSISIQRSQIPV